MRSPTDGTVSDGWSDDMVYVYGAGIVLGVGLVGYGVYKAYQKSQAIQAAEAEKAGADAGLPQ